jgi:hypothetical protein
VFRTNLSSHVAQAFEPAQTTPLQSISFQGYAKAVSDLSVVIREGGNAPDEGIPLLRAIFPYEHPADDPKISSPSWSTFDFSGADLTLHEGKRYWLILGGESIVIRGSQNGGRIGRLMQTLGADWTEVPLTEISFKINDC